MMMNITKQGLFQKARKNKTLYRFYSDYLYYKYKRLFDKDPKLAADALYYTAFKKHINWDNPQDLNEKIQWMLHNTDTSLWTLCADKYRVRDFVTQRNCSQYLVNLYGKWDDPEQIDFSTLPQQFVIKANNGCGTVMIIKDKSTIDEKKIKKELKRWIKRPFGYMGGQLHYLTIPRCIIAEELLEETGNNRTISSNSLIDYKIWCINGQPQCILVIFDRNNKSYYRQVYDLEWHKMPNVMNKQSNGHFNFKDIDVPQPACLDEMIAIARNLSEPFKEVRVDLYVINNRPYFGELTFTAGMGSFTEDFYLYLGQKIDLGSYLFH